MLMWAQGVLNPINTIGNALKDADPSITFIVDSMSGFGAYDVVRHYQAANTAITKDLISRTVFSLHSSQS